LERELTDWDIVLRSIAEDSDGPSTLVSDVMSSPVSCLTLDAGIFNVLQCIRRNDIRRVPIVDEQGTVVSLVSMGDMFPQLAEAISVVSERTAPEASQMLNAA
jgi:CBS domain-containing protein